MRKQMMCDRGMEVDHSTLSRWVQKYAPQLHKRCRPHLKLTNDSWRVDETYIKVKGENRYLYRAVDSNGNTLDFLGTAIAQCRKALQASHTQQPRVINVAQNAADPQAIDEMKAEEELPLSVEL
jgi:transposase-like protein